MDPRTTHGAFSWLEWQGDDDGSTRDFYARALGWTPVDMPMQAGGSYPGIAVGDAPVGGFSGKFDLPRQWLPYVTVDDVDARCRAVLEAGGEVLAEAFDAPGVGRIALAQDPAGAAFALITYPAEA